MKPPRTCDIRAILTAGLLLSLAPGCGGGNASQSKNPALGSGATQVASNPLTAPTSNPVPGTESSIGGGNALVCFDDVATAQKVHALNDLIPDELISKIKSVEMWDLVSAKAKRGVEGVTPELIDALPGEEPRHFALRVAARFRFGLPAIENLIIGSDIWFAKGGIRDAERGIPKINDINSVEAIDPKCVHATMAVQRERGVFDGKLESVDLGAELMKGHTIAPPELWIDHRLFDHPAHSAQSRGVLYLHEFLYLWARAYGETDSWLVRDTVIRMMTRTGLTSRDFTEWMRASWPKLRDSRNVVAFESGADTLIRASLGGLYAELHSKLEHVRLAHPERSELRTRACNLLTRAGRKLNCAFLNELEEGITSISPVDRELVSGLTLARRSEVEELTAILRSSFEDNHLLQFMMHFPGVAAVDAQRWYEVMTTSAIPDLAWNADYWLSFFDQTAVCRVTSGPHCLMWIDNWTGAIQPNVTIPADAGIAPYLTGGLRTN
jgi:hypothetical protein